MSEVSPITVGAALRDAARSLASAGVATPALDARLLLAHALGVDQAALIRRGREPLGGPAQAAFSALLDRRIGREPVSRIVGTREFYGRSFPLVPGVFDPRPDTETLVSAVLDLAGEIGGAPRFLDLGTGSGALVVTLLCELAGATGVGIDINPECARTARDTAARLGVGDRAVFLAGDWDTALSGAFDVIVANPPYIPSEALAGLEPEARDYDPRLALDGGADGLDGFRAVAAAAARLLEPARGIVVVEIGPDQADGVRRLFQAYGLVVDPRTGVRHDMVGRDRAVMGRAARATGPEMTWNEAAKPVLSASPAASLREVRSIAVPGGGSGRHRGADLADPSTQSGQDPSRRTVCENGHGAGL